METRTMRPYRDADTAALTDLLNTMERAAGAHPGYVESEVRGHVASMVADPARDTRLYLDGDVLIAAGLVATPPPGGFRVDLWGGVHPDHHGRGLGRELLGWQLDRAAAIHAAGAGGARWEAESGAIAGDTARQRLLERFGLAPVRYFFEMTAPTGRPAAAPLPAGLRCEPYRPQWQRALHAAHVEAFSDHWGYQQRTYEAWCALTVGSPSFRPELSRLAFAGDEIAGYLLSYDDASPERLYVGHIGTRRPWRRRGLAGALLAEVLAAAAPAGFTQAGLGVDADSPTGAVGVYERAGFAVESRSVAYRRALGG